MNKKRLSFSLFLNKIEGKSGRRRRRGRWLATADAERGSEKCEPNRREGKSRLKTPVGYGETTVLAITREAERRGLIRSRERASLSRTELWRIYFHIKCCGIFLRATMYIIPYFLYIERKKERNGIREGWRPKDRNQRLSSRVWLECARQGKRKGLFRDIIQINCAGGYGNSFDQKPFFFYHPPLASHLLFCISLANGSMIEGNRNSRCIR